MSDPTPYAVAPTQAWQVCEPESGLQHIQPPAAQGAASLGSYVYLFTQISSGQLYTQRILIQQPPNAPWITFLQGVPDPVADASGNPISSQAPPAAAASNDLIFLVFAGLSGDQHLYMSRFNGTTYEPAVQQFDDQFIAPGLSPCMAALDDQIFLVWAGAGYNGYFYSVGTIGAPDSFGATVQWSEGQVIAGTETWVTASMSNGNPSVTAFKTDTVSGFIFITEHFLPDAISYFVYDNATGAFVSSSPISLPWPADNPPGYTVTGCTLPASPNQVIPVLVDQAGNITYYQLDDSAPNFGTFADWLQCAIGGDGSGIDPSLSVGIPPSISISGNIDTSPTPALSAMTIYGGTNAGALISGQFYDPFIGDNELGFAGVVLGVQTLTPP